MACALVLAVSLVGRVSAPLGRAWPAGDPSGQAVVAGKGTFPRWQPLSIATGAPLRSIAALPSHGIAALDAKSTLWLFEIASTGLSRSRTTASCISS